MKRIPFSQVLKNASIDIRKEYDRLYEMFYTQRHIKGHTIYDCCGNCFMDFPFRGTCISLEDFEECHDIAFYDYPDDFDIYYLVSFCEYSYNLVKHTIGYYQAYVDTFADYIRQVLKVIEIINYMPNESEGGIIDFVPKDGAVISVAEIVNKEISYKVIDYNHHSMKGDLDGKRSILLTLAGSLEPKRQLLKQINSQMETDLFFLLNNVNIRHNNSDPTNKSNYHPCVEAMNDEEIEQWYDDTYQMCLLAFLELDNLDRKERVSQLKAQL